ncbi:hypothetical protein NX059_009305 [Plenodomus lindquistii]|nr:hypothetical protein NX059_009305 [Plenodomus lindquistii]
MSALYIPRYNYVNRAQMDQQLAAASAQNDARRAAEAAAVQHEADSHPNMIGADEAYDASSSTPSSNGPANMTQDTSYDSMPGPSNSLVAGPASPHGPYPPNSANNPPEVPTASDYRPPTRGNNLRTRRGLIPSVSAPTNTSQSNPENPFTDAAAIPMHPALRTAPSPDRTPLLPRPFPRPRFPYITRKSFLSKGLEITHYPLVVGATCPICKRFFDVQNSLAPRELPPRVMMTVKRCGCKFHHACVQGVTAQKCPRCGVKWWKRGFGQWFADVSLQCLHHGLYVGLA